MPYAGLKKGEQPVAVTNDPAIDWNPVWAPDGQACTSSPTATA